MSRLHVPGCPGSSLVSAVSAGWFQELMQSRHFWVELLLHYYLKTRACIDNPAHHAHMNLNDKRYVSPLAKWKRRHDATSNPTLSLKLEAAMTFAEIDVESVWPLRTPSFLPGPHEYNPKKHNLIEGVSKFWSLEKRPKSNSESIMMLKDHMMKSTLTDLRLTRGWGQQRSSSTISEWWEDLSPTVQKTPGQQHRLCCWGYSHYPGTRLL